MDFREQFQNVEEVLNRFPIEVRENYDTNKKTLIIEQDKNLKKLGVYDILKNKITLRNPFTLEHELFHMASSNREKFGMEFTQNFCIGGGVSYYRSNGKGPIYGQGLSEGFVQSLANMAKMRGRGYIFETYIVDFLVSIYGVDLYCFSLKNDPMGFYEYGSKNIHVLRKYLDLYCFCLDGYDELSKKSADSSELDTKLESILLMMKLTIQDIITEYNLCKYEPLITRRRFKEQIEEIFDDTIFWEFYELLPIRDKLAKEVMRMIHTDLVSTSYIIQEKAQKIKKFLHFLKY